MKMILPVYHLRFIKTALSFIKTIPFVWAALMLFQQAAAQQTPPGNALHFDGVDDYVVGSLTSDPHLQSLRAYTAETWVKFEPVAGNFNIMAIGNPNSSNNQDLLSLAYSTTGYILSIRVAYFTGNNPIRGAGTTLRNVRLVPSHWNHIAISVSETTLSIYVNGILTLANYSLPGIAVAPFYYGQNSVVNLGKKINETNGGTQLPGSLDEVKIWKTARTQEQILEDMTGPITNPASNTDLLMYYDCDGQGVAGADNTASPTAGTLSDRGPYSLNGTLNSFALLGTSSNWVNSYSMVIPTAAAATDISSTGFTANWTAPVLNIVDNFKVMVATDALFTQVVPGYDSVATTGNTTTLVISGLQPATQYYYRVRADKASVSGSGAFTAGTAVKTVGVAIINSFTPTYGQAGTTVTISGSNLSFTSAVSFGGTPAASFNIVNDNTIKATIGSGTSGSIGITTPAGTGSSAGSFTYVRPLLVTGISPSTGSLGTVVTISGEGFTHATMVRFGNASAYSFTIVSDEVITAVVNNGATGDVVVTNGTDYILPAAFIYVSNLKITAVAPAAAGTGTIVTITGQDFTGTTNVRFGGEPAFSFTVLSNTQINAVVGKGATGDVTVTNGTSYTLPAAFTYTSPAPPGHALQFDGINDYVRIIGKPLMRIDVVTLEFWMKTTQNTNGVKVGLVDGESGAANNVHDFGVYLVNGKVLVNVGGYSEALFGDGQFSVTSLSEVITGQWVHVAVVFYGPQNISAGQRLTIFINGKKEAKSWESAQGPFSISDSITLGAANNLAAGTFFQGSLDEVRFVAGDRSENILEDMSTSNPVTGPVPLVSYHFDQGEVGANNAGNDVLVDFGSQANSPQLTNFALQGNTSNWVESYAMVIPITSSATHVMPNGFTANWSLPPLGVADSIKVTVATDQAFSNILSGFNKKPLSGTATSLNITGLNPITPYYYQVQADKSSVKGQGANSPTMKVITPSIATAIPGNAIDFDGLDDYITIASPISKTFTIEFWMKTTQTGAGSPGDQWYNGTGIFDGNDSGSGSDFGIALMGGKLAVGYRYQRLNIISASDVNTGKWVHVAVVWEGIPKTGSGHAILSVFINGVAEATTISAGTYYYDGIFSSTFNIGANSNLSHFFKGSLDEFQIYDGDRTRKIPEDMLRLPNILNSDLLSYYDFEQGLPGQNNTGITTLFDRSLKNNNGTLYNFGLDGKSGNWVESYALAVPTALDATNIGGGAFTANWSAPAFGTVDHYLIDVATDATFTNKAVSNISADGGSTSIEIAGLSQLTTYYYRVVADKNTVTGEGSTGGNVIGFTTTACAANTWVASANISGTTATDISGSCGLVATVLPQGTNAVSGLVTGKVWIESTQPAKYLKRHYEITPAANASIATGKITLYFTQQEFYDFNSANSTKLPTGSTDSEGIGNLRIEKRAGTSSDGSGLPDTYTGPSPDTFKPSDKNGSASWNGDASRWEVSFEVDGFSGFFVKTADAALPLRLISFTGTQESATTKLQWSTADEVNTESFELESSRDGRNFQKVATIQAVSTGNHSYNYTDVAAYSGIVYYRLKMIDVDEKYTYSRMLSLGLVGKATINLYPNPVSDRLIVSVDNKLINSEATLYDIDGRLLQKIRITSTEAFLSVKTLTVGVYVIKFKDGTSASFAKE